MFSPSLSGYARKQLSGDERVVAFRHSHPIFLLRHVVPRVVVAAVVVAAFVVVGGAHENLKTIANALAAVVAVGALGWVLLAFLRWRFAEYVVTDRRLMVVRGILRKGVMEASLDKVNDTKFDQSVLGRLFGYGDLEIITASELPNLTDLHGIRDAQEFAKSIGEAREARREGMGVGLNSIGG